MEADESHLHYRQMKAALILNLHCLAAYLGKDSGVIPEEESVVRAPKAVCCYLQLSWQLLRWRWNQAYWVTPLLWTISVMWTGGPAAWVTAYPYSQETVELNRGELFPLKRAAEEQKAASVFVSVCF